jgi:hypothetical protein
VAASPIVSFTREPWGDLGGAGKIVSRSRAHQPDVAASGFFGERE